MSRYLVPSGYGDLVAQEDGEVAAVANSVLASMSPETALRLSRAVYRGQALRAMTPAVEQFALAAGDALRVRVTQTRRPVEAGFEVEAASRSSRGWCHSNSDHVAIRGRVWCSGAD